jgi:hypothetical protein
MALENEMKKWREDAEGARFFGRPVVELSRNELLSLIGFLVADAKKAQERFKFYFDLSGGVVTNQE